MLKHQPKTLAKTLDYIARRSPGEYGLFWDPDGTMPWKDFYWALQQDDSLRFVRESTIKEITLLGIELPFVFEGNLLRLRPEFGPPVYEPAVEMPGRLYFGLKPKNLIHTRKFGLKNARRPFVPLSSRRETALRIAGRTEEGPLLIEILALEASEAGLSFFAAGGDLYLIDSVPVEYILFPNIRRDLAERLAAAPAAKQKVSTPSTPGSFIVDPQYFEAPGSGRPAGKRGRRTTRQDGKRTGGKKEAKGKYEKPARAVIACRVLQRTANEDLQLDLRYRKQDLPNRKPPL